jgi:phage terminase large subunit
VILNVTEWFPEPPLGKPRGPLPKQQLFMNLAATPGTPKYIRYCGGIGSGKTLIGCIQVILWAVQHPGDYLVSRQYLPELKITTYKTFKEVCPPSLIAEERIADGIIRLRTAVKGKLSNVIFRGLDEPDKLRSLNLSGWYIDEANQVSEAAFQLLQGRLRGPGLRKGIMTMNSGGHDWSWRWFVKKDMIRGEDVKAQFVNIYAPSTENIHLPDGYVETMLATWSEERIKREILASEDSFEGQVYTEFRQDLHVIKPFAIPKDWLRYIGIDHGYRNPAAWLWAAMDYDGNLYVYREFYESEWLIEDICKKGKDQKPSVMQMMQIPGTSPPKYESIEWAKIDPSTNSRRNERDGKKLSDFDLYSENLPASFPLLPANNDVTPGIDKVKTWLKPDPNGRPRLFIFNTCENLIEEIGKYRYPELPVGQQGKKAEKENPMKVDDHACDALRYLVMGLPDIPSKVENIYDKIKYNSLEGALHRDLERLRNPRNGQDPFGL